MKKTLQEEQERFHQIVEQARNMAYGFKPNENIEGRELGPLASNPFKSSSSTSTSVDNESPNSVPEKNNSNGYQSYHINKEFRDFLGKILWELRPNDRNDGIGYSVYADRVAAILEKKYPKLKKM
jgi:hypothetical protein